MTTIYSHLSRQSLLLRLGLLMFLILLLAVIGMSSSVIIAETTQGVATAVNQSGSLRMQSFRIATGLASLDLATQPGYPHPAGRLIDEFETRFHSPRLTDAIPDDPRHPLHRAYRKVATHWQRLIGPLVRRQAAGESLEPAGSKGYLQVVDAFVADIDHLVRVLEEYAESKIALLRLIQGLGLGLTALVVAVSLVLIQRRLLSPLGELLLCAERARQGDFSIRTRHVSDDELGRLGYAFNLMAEDLSKMYAELERRVREKTEDLARRNRSLDLLYTTARQVSTIAIDPPSLEQLLRDIQGRLGVGPGTICLRAERPDEPGHRFASTRPGGTDSLEHCWRNGCRACHGETIGRIHLHTHDGATVPMESFPILHGGRHYGALIIDLPGAGELAPWQQQVLETVAGHIGSAIDNQRQSREERRLVLYEERGAIARELHDSLAQSLSYLKIQISRLDAALGSTTGGEMEPLRAREVSAELREGVTSAYRQLRELLTTFRLKMDGRGLSQALVDTVQEFRHRSTLEIELENRLPPAALSPNKEIHVLQIVREALSNIVRHAHARSARVILTCQGPRVDVVVMDDGQGLRNPRQGISHYGMTIMRERAHSLNGTIELGARPQGGTRVHLTFHRDGPHPSLEPANAS